jgi:hypothetical protein
LIDKRIEGESVFGCGQLSCSGFRIRDLRWRRQLISLSPLRWSA